MTCITTIYLDGRQTGLETEAKALAYVDRLQSAGWRVTYKNHYKMLLKKESAPEVTAK